MTVIPFFNATAKHSVSQLMNTATRRPLTQTHRQNSMSIPTSSACLLVPAQDDPLSPCRPGIWLEFRKRRNASLSACVNTANKILSADISIKHQRFNLFHLHNAGKFRHIWKNYSSICWIKKEQLLLPIIRRLEDVLKDCSSSRNTAVNVLTRIVIKGLVSSHAQLSE